MMDEQQNEDTFHTVYPLLILYLVDSVVRQVLIARITTRARILHKYNN